MFWATLMKQMELWCREDFTGRMRTWSALFILALHLSGELFVNMYQSWVFLETDLPCVAMEFLCEDWELIIPVKLLWIKCGQSVLNISMMQETVRVGDTADCGIALYSLIAHILWNWTIDFIIRILLLISRLCFINISWPFSLKHCCGLKISI